MKAYKLEILIVDHDEVGSAEMVSVIENARYPNRCIMPEVMKISAKDIGEWSDDHPFNNTATARAEYEKTFPPHDDLLKLLAGADIKDNSIIFINKQVISLHKFMTATKAFRQENQRHVWVMPVEFPEDDAPLLQVMSEEELNKAGWFRKDGETL